MRACCWACVHNLKHLVVPKFGLSIAFIHKKLSTQHFNLIYEGYSFLMNE